MLQIKLLRTVTWNSSTDICILFRCTIWAGRILTFFFSPPPFWRIFQRSKNDPIVPSILETDCASLKFILKKMISIFKNKFYRLSLRLSNFQVLDLQVIGHDKSYCFEIEKIRTKRILFFVSRYDTLLSMTYHNSIHNSTSGKLIIITFKRPFKTFDREKYLKNIETIMRTYGTYPT